MRIGFAGLGRMGTPMARNLGRAGFDLTVWTRDGAKAEALADEIGCKRAATPRDLAQSCDIVLTMLADDAASEAVHRGPEGLFAGGRARVFVEMGTMSPDHIAALAEAAPAGTQVMDAPVSGATQAASDGALLFMVGGAANDAEPLVPLFDAMGRQTVFLGKPGAGAVMKLAVNSLIHGLNQTLAEALCLSKAAGIAPEDAFDVIEASAAAAPMLSYRRPLYLDEASHPVTFTVALARKDMEITADLAHRLGTAMPQGRETLARLRDAEASGWGARDMAAMVGYMRKDAS